MPMFSEGGYDTKTEYRRVQTRSPEQVLIGEKPACLETRRHRLISDSLHWRIDDPESGIIYETEQFYAHKYATKVWICDHIEMQNHPDPIVIDHGYYRIYITYVWTSNSIETDREETIP